MSSINSSIAKFILTVFLFANVNTLNIPSYYKPCKFSDSKFQQCAVSLANTVLENYRKGDTTLIDAIVKDIKVPFYQMTDNSEVNINISDAHVLGYENLKILKIKEVPNKNRLEITAIVKEVKASGYYSVDAILDGKHVVGKGRGSITFCNIHYKCNFEWKLIEKNGAKYLEVTKSEISPDIDNVVTEIDGIDNRIMNENWPEAMAKIMPSVAPILRSVFHDFTDVMFNELPYNELFLD